MSVPRRPLGASGIDVPLLSLGTVKLGRNTGLKLPAFELPSDEDVTRLLNVALKLGINLLDTAPAYGSSEQRLGQLLPGRRHDWLLCTKVGEVFDGERSSWDFSPEHTIASIERSLQRLRTDVLDIVLVHSDGRDEAIVHEHGTLEALAELKSRGLVRAFGLSGKSAEGGRLALPHVDVLMATLNADDRSEAGLIADAEKSGVGVLVKKALGSGRHAPSTLTDVAASPGVSSIVLGTTNPDHLKSTASLLSDTEDGQG